MLMYWLSWKPMFNDKKSITRMLDLMEAKKNPYDMTMKVPFHNDIT